MNLDESPDGETTGKIMGKSSHDQWMSMNHEAYSTRDWNTWDHAWKVKTIQHGISINHENPWIAANSWRKTSRPHLQNPVKGSKGTQSARVSHYLPCSLQILQPVIDAETPWLMPSGASSSSSSWRFQHFKGKRWNPRNQKAKEGNSIHAITCCFSGEWFREWALISRMPMTCAPADEPALSLLLFRASGILPYRTPFLFSSFPFYFTRRSALWVLICFSPQLGSLVLIALLLAARSIRAPMCHVWGSCLAF